MYIFGKSLNLEYPNLHISDISNIQSPNISKSPISNLQYPISNIKISSISNVQISPNHQYSISNIRSPIFHSFANTNNKNLPLFGVFAGVIYININIKNSLSERCARASEASSAREAIQTHLRQVGTTQFKRISNMWEGRQS